jgi:predicted O-linked N-acetylglucosamine transferase (SPINDLY family)
VSGASAEAIAGQIRTDAIDILVDLSGYTLDARPEVFAIRPAPVAVAYLGYPGTSGAPFIDYLIADRVVVPPGDERYFSERLAYLPDTVWCYGCPALPDDRPPSREALGLPPSGFVFAALHNAYKITPEIFDCWMTLLARVERSVLWVLARRDPVRENLRREAARRGVDPDRIVFAGRTSYVAHLARLCAADLFLDTPAYSTGTTCLDALWAGLPVLACPAGSYAGRQSASALAAAGLHELIATGLDDYLARAMRLASNPGALAAVKARVAASRPESPLFDVAARVRELETAFRAMVERARAGMPPAALAVAPGGRSAAFVK